MLLPEMLKMPQASDKGIIDVESIINNGSYLFNDAIYTSNYFVYLIEKFEAGLPRCFHTLMHINNYHMTMLKPIRLALSCHI